MAIYKSEGIALQTIKFGDYDQILTLFTPHEGLLKMMVKGAYGRKHSNGLDLLAQAEFVYAKRQSALVVCQERKILNSHLSLRKSLLTLESACAMAKAVLDTQFEQKPAHQLYSLLICYFKRLAASINPAALTSSFLLKLLRSEGLFGLTPHCSVCFADLHEHFISSGESFCQKHAPAQAASFTLFEAESIFTLAFSRSFADIEKSPLEDSLKAKIESLFASLTRG